MTWTPSKIRKTLGGKLIGKKFVQNIVCKTLSFLPDDILERVCKTVWFISSPDDAWAFTFKGTEIRKRHLIFLSDELFTQDKELIVYTILHEVGHVVLNHRNSIGYEQTKTEIKRQEKEADTFAREYLN